MKMPYYADTYEFLIRSIRATINKKSAPQHSYDGDVDYVPFRLTPRIRKRVANYIVAAQAIQELSGSWPPNEIIDPKELKELEELFHQRMEEGAK